MQCPKVRWQKCPRCQERIKAEGLTDEYHLQSWFISRISKFLYARKKHMIGWDEILEGGIPHDAVVMSWRVSLCLMCIVTTSLSQYRLGHGLNVKE